MRGCASWKRGREGSARRRKQGRTALPNELLLSRGGNRNRARQSFSLVWASTIAGASAADENQRNLSSLNGSNNNSGVISYQASSPDEAALVNAARILGFTYLSRSNRDTVIDHLHEFAVEGLRTLCLAYADLDDDGFQDWHRRYRHANSELIDREEKVAAVVDEFERDLTLLGATAIEDKLQDGVPETLKKLEQASIKVWVLTGDKQETAINIGLSCGAIDEGMDVVIINEDNLEDTAAQLDRALGRWSAMRTDPAMERKLGLVIDGQTLHYALEEELQKRFMVVTNMARSVIACRVSPKQKTEIVELVRRLDKDKVTLAIGDGANDVGMIQAAHVGMGIVSLEGQEAKLASDYSIGQFRFLGRVMLVHGRWSYKRLSKMVLFTIYRNAALTLCEIYWAFFSAFSGQPLLDPWMGGLYNLLLASLPPIVLGIFDQELTAEYALAFPEMYSKGQRNTAYNFRVFLSWILSAIWQSDVVFFVCFWGFGDIPQAGGQMLRMWAFGTVVFSVVIFTVHVMLLVYQTLLLLLSRPHELFQHVHVHLLRVACGGGRVLVHLQTACVLLKRSHRGITLLSALHAVKLALGHVLVLLHLLEGLTGLFLAQVCVRDAAHLHGDVRLDERGVILLVGGGGLLDRLDVDGQRRAAVRRVHGLRREGVGGDDGVAGVLLGVRVMGEVVHPYYFTLLRNSSSLASAQTASSIAWMHMLNKTSELLNLHGIRLVQAPIYTIYDEQFGKGRKSICPHIVVTATPQYPTKESGGSSC
ncbi:unnamed protein product [Chondrus crispus]|uniref:Phospholipid-transporting ATPase n=1 Tax=Chondrus crispus TaxID=2769 RepID=R7QQ37_CHOCR|nr:unnamed protein product [Chondrus crispus]CDF40607.1 unnamed protein product [Chondrus crispus]|eukprot:XP_005710901.1 unnamed protein product [Chondrus crispus]